jgi:hypothetical protein
MFNCQMCGKPVPPGIKCTEVVTKKRSREYPYRESVNRPATWKSEKFDRIASTNDYGGLGWEAAVTKKSCPACAKSFRAAEQFDPKP